MTDILRVLSSDIAFSVKGQTAHKCYTTCTKDNWSIRPKGYNAEWTWQEVEIAAPIKNADSHWNVWLAYTEDTTCLDVDDIKVPGRCSFADKPCSEEELETVVLPMLFDACPELKRLPYSLSDSKKLPHFYMKLVAVPKFSNEVKVAADDRFDVDLIRQKRNVRERKGKLVHNYDEAQGVPYISWFEVASFFDINKMSPVTSTEQYKWKPAITSEKQSENFAREGGIAEAILNRICEQQPHKYASYDQWFRLLCMMKNSFGEQGWDLFERICKKFEGFNASSNREVWDKTKPVANPLTIATLFKENASIAAEFAVAGLQAEKVANQSGDIAALFCDIYARENLIFDGIDTVYAWNNDCAIWEAIVSGRNSGAWAAEILKELHPKLKSIIAKAIKAVEAKSNAAPTAYDKDKASKQRDALIKLDGKLRDNKFKKEILQELLPLIKDASIKTKINNTATHELPLDRRVNVDLKTATCKERTRTDYFSFYLQGYYLDDDLLQKYAQKYIPDDLPEDPALLFMSNIFVDTTGVAHADLIEQMQMICGYWLSGRIDHRKFYLLNGGGSNGKSYFLKFFDLFLKPLHKTAVPKIVMESKNESDASPENNLLRDSRLVTFSEGKGEQRLNDALIKRITGGDRITGRQLFSNTFDEFYSQSKISILTNKMPKFDADDQAMLDRIMVLPFNARYPQDENDHTTVNNMTPCQRARYEAAKPLVKDLSKQNLEIWSPFKNAVFNWMIAGAKKAYHPVFGIKQGYSGCLLSQVKKDEYVTSNDDVALYIRDQLVRDPQANITVKDLCFDYRQWLQEQSGETKIKLTNKQIQDKFASKFSFIASRNKGPLVLLGYRARTVLDDEEDRNTRVEQDDDDEKDDF